MKDELRAPQVLQFLHNLESFRLDRKNDKFAAVT
jgi:hypothetical protein